VRHVFHPEARSEFSEAVLYFKARGYNLAVRFDSQVRTTIQRIVETPERWRELEPGIRRCFVEVFPYSVVYSIEPKFVLIIAIAHAKRAPGYWRRRVETKTRKRKSL
jgi:toxin ParE1/3/4